MTDATPDSQPPVQALPLPLLRVMLHAVAEAKSELEVTLITEGMFLSGKAVSPPTWYRALGDVRRPDGAMREVLQEYAVLAEQQGVPEPDELQHVYLLADSAWAPGSAGPSHLSASPWQVRIDRITGWTLGVIVEGAPG